MKEKIKKIKKDVRGITLIALVVTIIVLLILAGIALNLTIGQNGIFSRAQDAANTWRNAEANEQLALGEGADLIDEYLNGNNDNPSTGITTVDNVPIPDKNLVKKQKQMQYQTHYKEINLYGYQ